MQLSPEEPLIRIMFAQALLGTKDMQNVDEAISNLRIGACPRDHLVNGLPPDCRGLSPEKANAPRDGPGGHLMAQAELASAEAYFYEGRLKLAKQQAKRAKAGLVDGTPNWLRADDILAFQMPTDE